MKNLDIKSLLREHTDMYVLESLLDEDYPTSFDMEKFKTLRSFSDRIKYCADNLKRISSGSSRIVYMIDNEKVLKLAKNKKGLSQNETEINWGNDSYFSNILAKVFDSEDNNLWVEMELARKVNDEDFQNYVGFSIKDVYDYLRIFYHSNVKYNPDMLRMFGNLIDPDKKSVMDDNPFVSSISEFMANTDSPAGDFGRLSSYGLVKRDGQDAVVIIDYGLTGDVYSTYYS